VTDFVADFTPALIPEANKEMVASSKASSGTWTLFIDDASNGKGSGPGIVLKPPSGNIVRQSIRTLKLTNNEAKSEAIIAGLKLTIILGAEVIEAKSDSLLVVNQINGAFEVRE